MLFKGKSFYYDQDIKTGICSVCKRSVEKKQIHSTSLHHLKYDDSDPLKHTIEVCTSCHMKNDKKCYGAVISGYRKKRQENYHRKLGVYTKLKSKSKWRSYN